MKRKIILLLLLAIIALKGYAEGLVYDPTEFKPIVNNKETSKTQEDAAKTPLSDQSVNFNNALFELDSAQVNIRNELLEYQSKYQEIDTQYKLIKEQRRVLANQIKEINRKVTAIEKSKNQIRKSMT